MSEAESVKNQEEKQPMNLKKEIISWICVILGGFLLALFVTKVVIIKADIPTSSMENTIMTNDKVIVNRLAYLFTKPKRGDIIIFHFHHDPDKPEDDYVKRVIGLPGETVRITEGKVYIDDKLLEEDYLKEEMRNDPELIFEVPEGHYFVMGDNRNISDDARYWVDHYVSTKDIEGKVLFRYYPSWGKVK